MPLMDANVKVVFYKTISGKSLYTHVLTLYRFVAGRCCTYEHCAVVLNFLHNDEEIMYHVGTNVKSKWIKARVLKNFKPEKLSLIHI